MIALSYDHRQSDMMPIKPIYEIASQPIRVLDTLDVKVCHSCRNHVSVLFDKLNGPYEVFLVELVGRRFIFT